MILYRASMFFSIPHSLMGDQLLNLASSRKRSLLKPFSPDPSSFSVDLEIRSCSSPDTDIFSAISFILHSSYVKRSLVIIIQYPISILYYQYPPPPPTLSLKIYCCESGVHKFHFRSQMGSGLKVHLGE